MKLKLLALCIISLSFLSTGCATAKYLSKDIGKSATKKQRMAASQETQLCAAKLQYKAAEAGTVSFLLLIGAPIGIQLYHGMQIATNDPMLNFRYQNNVLAGTGILAITGIGFTGFAWSHLARASKYNEAAVKIMQNKEHGSCDEDAELNFTNLHFRIHDFE